MDARTGRPATGVASVTVTGPSLTWADIDATAREIRIALLEADVALPVVKEFVGAVKERARSEEVSGALNPAQQIIKIVHEELVTILGGETRRLRFAKNPPTVQARAAGSEWVRQRRPEWSTGGSGVRTTASACSTATTARDWASDSGRT